MDMELERVFSQRKSIRSYTGEKITRRKLKDILDSANQSPVGRGKYDTLHITVVENKEVLSNIDTISAEMFGDPKLHPLYGAPTFIIISVKPSSGGDPGNVEFSNAAIMAANMALTAVEKNIGCCLIWGAVRAINGNRKIIESLDLPDGFIPCCGIVAGISEEEYPEREIDEDRISINYID